LSKHVFPPATRPCGSCPYRRDVQSGVWAPEEYAKLPEYDRETFEQPPAVFLCHQQDGRLCAGWTAVHDMENSLGFRIASIAGMIDVQDIDAILNYSTNVPLFSSGREAADHGLQDIESPGLKAERTMAGLRIKKLIRLAR
jgi:hypothetical protein